MKRHSPNSMMIWMIQLIIVGSVLTIIWYMCTNKKVKLYLPPPPKKRPPPPKQIVKPAPIPDPDPCNGCRVVIKAMLEKYTKSWKKHEENFSKYRTELREKCSGFKKAIVTKTNTPVKSTLTYDGERKKKLQVTNEIYDTFVKDDPLADKKLGTCSVVGNGGILVNSSCGKMIDAADFVMRCNLPPVGSGYENHVGIKTNVVTANPSIIRDKYGQLMDRRRSFVAQLQNYGSSLLMLPAFSFNQNTRVCLRAVYTLEDFQSPILPVFFHPHYLRDLAQFWLSKNLKIMRLSTGMIMVSLALEVCDNVHLYGFWPFDYHPDSYQTLMNHYYDDVKPKPHIHDMPAEFKLLLQLHNEGVLKLHLGCPPGGD